MFFDAIVVCGSKAANVIPTAFYIFSSFRVEGAYNIFAATKACYGAHIDAFSAIFKESIVAI